MEEVKYKLGVKGSKSEWIYLDVSQDDIDKLMAADIVMASRNKWVKFKYYYLITNE